MTESFPKPGSLGADVKVELDLSNYASKADLTNSIGDDTSDFTKKTHSANLKDDVDQIDIDKLKNVPSGLKS